VGGLFQWTTFPTDKNTQQPSFDVQLPNSTLPDKELFNLPHAFLETAFKVSLNLLSLNKLCSLGISHVGVFSSPRGSLPGAHNRGDKTSLVFLGASLFESMEALAPLGRASH